MTRHSAVHLVLLFSVAGVLAGCGEGGDSVAPWAGKTYLLDTPKISANNWTKPKGFGSEVGSYVPQFLIGVAAGTGRDLTITLTTAIADKQDMCNQTTQLTVSGANYPSSLISLPSFPIHVVDSDPDHPAQVHSTAHDFVLKDMLPGTSAVKNGVLDTVVDIAELYRLFYLVPNASPDTVCATLQNEGNVPCEVCSFNQQQYCLTIQATEISAKDSPVTITPLTASDIASNPLCQP